MRITEIHIDRWRNLRDISYEVPYDSTLVALVGSNGTGKTSLLELLSFAAAHFGMAAGVRPQQRSSPPPEAAARIVFYVSDDVELPRTAVAARLGEATDAVLEAWDRTLVLWQIPYVPAEPPRGVAQGYAGTSVVAGGLDYPHSQILAETVVQTIHQRLELNHLFLDAERTFGPVDIRDEQILAASREDPNEPSRVRQQAISATANMYAEWLRDALGLEHRHASEFAQGHRVAATTGEKPPEWQDPWNEYREALGQVLPHLMFSRPDQEQRTLTFNAGGAELAYHELSGGEREVAFLVGQLLRFRLTRGLLLVDEPELHLNAELLERWLAWVQDSIADGQVWLATHSLEAVEAAGPENALVLERASDGQVRSINRLSDRPVISTLSGALGAPAFSLDRQRFVLIEGERPGRERRRFASLCPGVANLYLEAGNCNQVVSKLKLVSEFAQESDRLHIGGVVDRDHWDARQRARMTQDAPVHVLGVHEIENFFLLPAALSIFSQRQGRSRETAPDLLRRACDQFAGLWIVQRAAIRHDVDLGPKVRTRGGALTWGAIEGREAETAEELRQLVDFVEPALVAKVEEWFIGAINAYAKVRYSETLWAECSGKQVAGTAAPLFGIASAADLEAQVLTLLKDGTVEPPPTLIALREYVQNISAAPAA